MASFRAAPASHGPTWSFSLKRYPEAVGSYAAHASHIATDTWNRLRAWTGGFGSARRIASSNASSQRRATDAVAWYAPGGQGGGPCQGRVMPSTAPLAMTTAASAAAPMRTAARDESGRAFTREPI